MHRGYSAAGRLYNRRSIQEEKSLSETTFYKTENQKNQWKSQQNWRLRHLQYADCAGGHIRGGNRINIGTVKLTEYGTTEYQCAAENVVCKKRLF